MKILNPFILAFFLLLTNAHLFSQAVGINDNDSFPDSNAMLHILSSNKNAILKLKTDRAFGGVLDTTYALQAITVANGSQHLAGISSSVAGSGDNDIIGTQNKITVTGDGNHYGIYNNLTGTGGIGNRYGAYYKIEDITENADYFGSYQDMTATQFATVYGSFSNSDHAGAGTSHGNHVEITGAGTGPRTGSYHYIAGSGNASRYGTLNTIVGVGTANSYGVYNNMFQHGSGKQYGTYSMHNGSGSGDKYGAYHEINATGIGPEFGTYVYIRGLGPATKYGTFHRLDVSSDAANTGVRTFITSSGEGVQRGTDILISNSGDGHHYGTVSSLGGTGNGSQFGSYNIVSNLGDGIHYGTNNSLNSVGTGTKYGSYNSVSNLGGGAHYAGYFYAPGDANDYAAVFHAGNVVANEIGGNYDFRVETENDVNQFFVQGSTDRVGFGTATPERKVHIQKNDTNGAFVLIENTNTGTNSDGLLFRLGPTTGATTTNVFVGFRDGADNYLGGISGDGSGGIAYNTVSDRRLKQNIHDFENGLDLVKRITAKEYEMKINPAEKQIGFIAQELFEVFPQIVSGTPDNPI